MEDKLIDYLLGALEAEETMLVEQALHDNPTMVKRLEICRIAIEPLRYLSDPVELPDDLAARTCQRIREMR